MSSSSTSTTIAGDVSQYAYAASPTHAPLRWGILGTGKIAEDFANALLPCADVVLQAVGSRSIESANRFADIFGIVNRHASYDSLVNDPTVDIVYVASPDEAHGAHGLLVLNAGKHLLMEKPFTHSVASADAIFEASKRAGKFVMEAMWTRFMPSMQHTLQLIRDGVIGEVTSVDDGFGFENLPLSTGALNAIGVYNVALSTMIYEAADEYKRKSAVDAIVSSSSATPVVPSRIIAVGTIDDANVDQQCSVILQYGPRQVATSTCSLIGLLSNEAVISGSKGRITMCAPLWHSTTKTIVEVAGQPERVYTFDGMEKELNKYTQSFNCLNSERLIYEVLEVHRCIRGGQIESASWSHQHARNVMAIMESVRAEMRK